MRFQDETIAEWRRYQAFRAEWRTVPILVAHDIKLRCLQLCLLGLSSDAFTTLDSGGDRWNDVIHGVRTLFDFYKELANKDFDNEKKARLISKWLKRLVSLDLLSSGRWAVAPAVLTEISSRRQHHSIEQMREYCVSPSRTFFSRACAEPELIFFHRARFDLVSRSTRFSVGVG